jgi:GTP-binding protein
MKVTQAEFIISAMGPDQFPQDALPEIALAGRSNVGKSSLINKLINRKNLARTSSVPGKTQTLNYYRINEQFYFVDFPGYGYAKVSKTMRERWGQIAEAYLRERESLRLVLQVIDLRHPPSAEDKAMNEWLLYYGIPRCVVATKADKIPRSRWDKHLKVIRQSFEMTTQDPLIMFSSETGAGKDEVWGIISKQLEESTVAE